VHLSGRESLLLWYAFALHSHEFVAVRFNFVTSEARVDQAPLADASSGRTVLIVEDEAVIREVVSDVLEERGFHVLLAANGAEALLLLESRRPDVMVLDLLMPVMHGWAFMESYLEKTDGTPIPIVVLSVNAALPRSFDRFGVRQVLAKPFDVDVLVEAVDRAAPPLVA
jgi:two-component system, chemotaxis family, chemotaxis protein CheY